MSKSWRIVRTLMQLQMPRRHTFAHLCHRQFYYTKNSIEQWQPRQTSETACVLN